MSDFEIWWAYTKADLKVGIILAIIFLPFFIWYIYDIHRRIEEMKKMKERMNKSGK